jgi:WD40 repeat protein/serine/threonine protein kinase
MAAQRATPELFVNAARWQQIKSAFDEVLQLGPSLRFAYIKDLGATDPDLRQRVESLLVEHEQGNDEFMRNPAANLTIFSDLMDRGDDSCVGRQIGPYRLLQEIGSGGMGEVYLAKRDDAEFDQRVAIKLIRSGQDSAAVVSRFKAERQILAGLDHPNIAKLLDGGRTPQGQPYFVMEYVPGLPITAYCDQKQLNIHDRLELLIQACEGVRHAHQNAIIHRDLKPSNILVVDVDGKAVPRIIDFGLAKTTAKAPAEQTQLTKYGVFMGTPGFMSPEQADFRVQNLDTRTDVYSLGAILYVLLTGRQPFETLEGGLPPFDEWLRRLREEPLPRPSASRRLRRGGPEISAAGLHRDLGKVPADLDWITAKALERDRERRYQSTAELALDLRRYLQHEPISARPPSYAYQIRKFVRRNRVAATALVAVALAISGGVALALWQARVASIAAGEAHTQELAARAQAVKVRQMGALSAEQAGDAASQLGFASAAVARLAYAVRLDPDNPALRSHLLQLLDEQDLWWLPLGPSFHHAKAILVKFSPDASRVVTGSLDGSVIIWDLKAGRQAGKVIHTQGAIYSLRFSPDGKRVLTGSADHTARVWDADTGEPLGPALIHADAVNDADFSHDGERVVTASEDHTARIWDWRSGQAIGAPMRHAAAVYSIVCSQDDAHIVTSSADHTARLWDGRAGRPLGPPLRHAESVHYAEFSPDGERVVTASKDNTARVWNVRTGKAVGEPMRHTWVVTRARFSPDGTRVLTSSIDRTARFWDASSGKPVGDPMSLALQALATGFSTDGQLAFTALVDGTVRAWDGHAGRPKGAVVRLMTSDLRAAFFSRDGGRLVTVASDGTVQIWEHRMSSKSREPLRQDGFAFMSFSPDGRRVVTNSSDHTATIWDTSSQPLLVLHHEADVYAAEISADGKKILTASGDHTLRLWDATTGEPIGLPMRHDRSVWQMKFSPDGSLILSVLGDGTVRLWDAATARARGAPLLVGQTTTEAGGYADFSPDGTRVGAAINDAKSRVGVLQLWDVRTGMPIGLPMSHFADVNDWRFSPDGTRIATVSMEHSDSMPSSQPPAIRLWNAHTGAPLSEPVTFDQDERPSLQFNPAGTRLLTPSVDGTARLWDVSTGVRLDRAVTHEAGVMEGRFSPDGSRILTASLDQTARVWDAHTGAPVGAPLRHEGIVWSARFSADGKRIATASADRTAQVWDAETHAPLTGPMRHEWPVRFAVLSRDGTHVITTSVDRRKQRLWPVLTASRTEALDLAEFAEAIGGYRIDAGNALVPVRDRIETLDRLRAVFTPHDRTPSDVERIFKDLVLSENDPVLLP